MSSVRVNVKDSVLSEPSGDLNAVKNKNGSIVKHFMML